METPQKIATYVDATPKKQQVYKKKDTLGPTAGHGVTMSPCCSLWLLRCHKRSGTEASRRGKNWMSEYRPDMIRMIANVFLTLEEQNRVTAQAKRKFSLLSYTPANRNECPCCKHFLTTPANTSILSLSLKNQNFKFVTLTRAPSQPVALFFQHSPNTHMTWSLHRGWRLPQCEGRSADQPTDHQRPCHPPGICQHLAPWGHHGDTMDTTDSMDSIHVPILLTKATKNCTLYSRANAWLERPGPLEVHSPDLSVPGSRWKGVAQGHPTKKGLIFLNS